MNAPQFVKNHHPKVKLESVGNMHSLFLEINLGNLQFRKFLAKDCTTENDAWQKAKEKIQLTQKLNK